MKSKGAVPVPYIIALILGVLVLGFVTYSLFFSNNEFGSSLKEYGCRSRKMSYCSAWENDPDSVGQFSLVCGDKDDSQFDYHPRDYYAPTCCEFDWAHGTAYEVCQESGGSGGSGGRPTPT